jgi:hypothetical protein
VGQGGGTAGRFKAWQAAHELAPKVYELTDRWPSEERFGVLVQEDGQTIEAL